MLAKTYRSLPVISLVLVGLLASLLGLSAFTSFPQNTLLVPTLPQNQANPNDAPTISAKINTNCRLGPDPDYPVVSALVVGKTATVLGRNDDSSWWFIQDPLDSTETCWVWSGSTQIQGDSSSLPVVDPPFLNLPFPVTRLSTF